jgi:hypothetical protein
MRTAKGMAIDAIEAAQDNLIVASKAGQVDEALFSDVFDSLLAAKVKLVNAPLPAEFGRPAGTTAAEAARPGELSVIIRQCESCHQRHNILEPCPETRTCRRCRLPIEPIASTWVVTGTGTTADGLSYCPPNPDAASHGVHRPAGNSA